MQGKRNANFALSRNAMFVDFVIAVLLSLSPFGEGKAGIPYGILKGLNIYLVFFGCFLANALIFPMMMFFLDRINKPLLRWGFYKKSALWVARRTKTGSGDKIKKYGFWGLLIFVMVPLPGTGAYAGSIAAYLFKIDRRKAFWANTIGIFLSSAIVWFATLASIKAI